MKKSMLMTAGMVTAGFLALTGCGSSDSGNGGGDTTNASESGPLSPEAAALLPDRIKESGVIKVATDAHYAPMDFYEEDGTTLTGADYEMGQALGEVLGVEMRVTDVAFASIIPSLQAGQNDMAVTFMNDTVERQEAIDFVDSYQSGSSILVAKGNPEGIESMTDLCGLTVVTTPTSTQNDLARSFDQECADLGKDPIDVMNVDTDTDALLQVKSGRAVADLAEAVAAAYNAETSGGGEDFEVVGEMYDSYLVGMAIPKGEDELVAAVKAGMEFLLENGTYHAILSSWGLDALAVDEITVNGTK